MDVSILGPLEVRHRGTPVPVRRGKPAALLALLVLRRNEVVPSEWLIEELWEGHEPATAAKALQTYVSELRRVLPAGTLETRQPGYVLRVEPGAVDSERFEAMVADGRAALEEGRAAEARRTFAQALEVWRGAALADFAYERFAEAERERLEEVRLLAVERRIDAELALGAGGELVSELQALVRAHPLREAFTRQLMLALYRAGRQADALAAYRESRRRLRDSLGLEPSRVLQDLERAILAQDPELGPPQQARVASVRGRLPRRWKFAIALAGFVLVAIAATAFSVPGATERRPDAVADGGLAVPPDVRLPFPSVPVRLLGAYSAKWNPEARAMETLTIRAATDPVCTDLLGGDKTCFTIVPVDNPRDPGARGEAAIKDGTICLRYMRVPFMRRCEGQVHRYRSFDGGRTFILAERGDDCSFASFRRGA